MPFAAIEVEGIAHLNRAFAQVDRKVKREKTRTLRQVAEPVRLVSQSNALANISNIGDRWSEMKVGSSTSLVYVAPKARRRGGSPRANLRGLLQTQMQAALDEQKEQVVKGLERWLDEVGNSEGF